MLSIVTGLPGAGKTLYLLSKIIPGRFRGRSIYVYGIPGIDHDYFGTQDLDKPEKWYDLDEGSVIIIDEAQKIFPLRQAGSKVPPKCSEFETHRHRGMDIVLLTQDATTLDVHIRKLAGQHIHVVRLFGGLSANIYEYPNYEQKPTDRNTRRTAVSTSTWRYDKKVFDHYKSADLHTVKRKIPLKLIVLPLLAIGVIAAIWFALSSMFRLVAGSDGEPGMIDSMTAAGSNLVTGEVSPGDQVGYLESMKPRIEGMPWTAPIFDQAFKVQSFPIPHCIIHSQSETLPGGICICYSQQITKLDVSKDVCVQIALEGWFNPALDARRERRSAERVYAAPHRSAEVREFVARPR